MFCLDIKRLVAFIRENALYIALAALSVVAGLYVFVFSRKPDYQPIPVPFVDSYDGSIQFSSKLASFDKKVMVYRADVSRESRVTDLMRLIGLVDFERLINSEEISQWISAGDTVYFNKRYGVLVINLEQDLRLDLPKESVIDDESVLTYLKEFIETYFEGFPSIRVVAVDSGVDSVTVSAVMNPPVNRDVDIASLYMDGLALKVEFTELGDLRYLSVLMIENISEFQSMPTISLSELSRYAGLRSYPRKINYEVTDPDFAKVEPHVQAGSKLISVGFGDSRQTWIFVDSDYSYIVPVYLLEGDGLVRDSLRSRYSSSVTGYFCAIDPYYLYSRTFDEADETPVGGQLDAPKTEEEDLTDDEIFQFDTVGSE